MQKVILLVVAGVVVAVLLSVTMLPAYKGPDQQQASPHAIKQDPQ
jgi:hypothetical protein